MLEARSRDRSIQYQPPPPTATSSKHSLPALSSTRLSFSVHLVLSLSQLVFLSLTTRLRTSVQLLDSPVFCLVPALESLCPSTVKSHPADPISTSVDCRWRQDVGVFLEILFPSTELAGWSAGMGVGCGVLLDMLPSPRGVGSGYCISATGV